MKLELHPFRIKTLSLRQALLLGFVLPLISAGGLAFYLLWQNQQRAIQQLVLQIHERVGDRIQARLLHLTDLPPRSTRMMLQALERGNLKADNVREWGTYLRDQSDLFPSLTFIYFGNQAGDYVELYKRSDGTRQIIIRSGQQSERLQQLNPVNPALLKDVQVTSPYDPRARPWYKDAALGGTRWTEVYDFFLQSADLAQNEPFPTTLGVSFVRPVYEESGGNLVGVLGSDFTLIEVNRFLQKLQISPSGQAFVMNRQGNLIASSHEKAPVETAPRSILQIENSTIQSAGKYLRSHFGGIENITTTHTLSFHYEGQRHILQVRPFADAFGLDWLIVVVVPESDFTQSMQMNSRWTVLLAFGIAGLAVALALFMVRKISQATQRLQRASAAIAAGDFLQSIPGSSLQELDITAQSFNHMSQELQNSYTQIESYSQSLEEKVQLRTRELETEVEERKLANVETQLSQKRYQSLFENAPISLWEADFSLVKTYLDELAECHSPFNIKQYLEQHPKVLEDCIKKVRILDVNQAALELLEADKKNDLLCCFDHESPEAIDGFKQELIALVRGEINYEREQVGFTLTGRKKDVLLKFSLVVGHEQSWSRVLISMVDISDRKFAEDVLRQRANRDRLSSQISKALMNQDIDPAIHIALRKLGEFINCDRVCIFEFLKQGQLKMTHEWSRPGIDPVIQYRQQVTPEEYPWLCAQVSQLKPFQFEDLALLPEEAIATRREFRRQSIQSFLNIPLVYRDQAIGLMGLDAVRSSKQWSHADVDFCQLIGEIIAIAQGRNAAKIAMIQAKEEAEAANLVKSEFLANMSHELRSPLNAILGFSQLMARSRSLPSEHRDDIKTIHQSGEYLLSLINDVLDMSKIEAGKISINPVDFNLDHLLDDLEKLFQLKAREKQLALSIHRDATLPNYISADQRKLRQILINLMGNAFKFTQAGHIFLRVSRMDAKSDLNPQSRPMLLFDVKDTGQGVCRREMAQVFDPFIQTQTGKASPEGTGLGLPISRNYVELMGGKMLLLSRVADEPVYGIGAQDISTPLPQTSDLLPGTSVRFTIPLLDVQSAQAVIEQPKSQVITLAQDQQEYRILVVDDSPYNRKLMLKLLQSVGFIVRLAKDGQEALDAWREWRPDWIWMDLKMPTMDGLESTRRIRQASVGDSVQPIIVALSASSIRDDQRSALDAGCDAYMRKPFRERDVFDLMHQLLGVHFVYEEPEWSKNISVQAQMASTSAVENIVEMLPKDILQRLELAIIGVDWRGMMSLIREIQMIHADSANALSELIHNYQYQPILDVLQGVKERQ